MVMSMEMKRTCTNCTKDSKTRPGSAGVEMMRARLIDAATKTRPTRVAAAVACRDKCVCHSRSDSGDMLADYTEAIRDYIDLL